MADQREFIVRCDHIANNIWDVSHRWVDSGECDEVVRCRDCVSFDDAIGAGWCWACDCGTQPDGFCHRGERRDQTP